MSRDPAGGESRITACTPDSHVMLACRGVGLTNTVKEVMAASVLQVGICVSSVLPIFVSSVRTRRGRGCC